MENSGSILRIGSQSIEGFIEPKGVLRAKFDVIAIKAGYHKYPKIKTYLNKKEIKEEGGTGIVCVI